jgi:alanine dehydrogenase
MIVGVPKEIKDNEACVGVTPAGVKALNNATFSYVLRLASIIA